MVSGPDLPVTFVLRDREPVEQLAAMDPDRDWSAFVTGERMWVLQTYLRLRSRGAPVGLSDRLPADGIAVFSSKQRRWVRSLGAGPTAALLVGVREDVGEALIADVEVVQNSHQADGERRVFIPLWPQPGLLPRDSQRGTRVETIAFKGFSNNLHPAFQSEAWPRFLAAHGLRWQADAVPFVKHGVTASALAWNDYRTVDLILAVRPPDRGLHPRKPATKLYNAWHAGVPALLGPELAYRELRTSALDYIEIRDRAEAETAVLRLRGESARYREMVALGRRRAAEYSVDAIARRWEAFLFETIPQVANLSSVRRWRGKSLRMKELVRRVSRATGRRR